MGIRIAIKDQDQDQDLQKPYPIGRHIPIQPINGSTAPGCTCNIYKNDVVSVNIYD